MKQISPKVQICKRKKTKEYLISLVLTDKKVSALTEAKSEK